MLQLFKNNDISANILVLLYFTFFVVGLWIYPTTELSHLTDMPASWAYFLTSYLSSPLFNKISFMLILLIQALYINYLVNEYKISRQNTTITAVCFILLHFVHQHIDWCSPLVFANTFLLFSLHSLLKSYNKKVSLGTIFNIGFWAGTAALCYHSYLVFLLWAMIGLIHIRTFDAREFLLLVLGGLVPFFLVGTAWFAFDGLEWWWAEIVSIHNFNSSINFAIDNAFIMLVVMLVSPFLLAIININSLQFKTTTKEKKFINVILLMPIVGALSFLFQYKIYIEHWLIFVVPIGILFSLVVQSFKNALWAELLHLIIFMLCLGIQYQQFFFS